MKPRFQCSLLVFLLIVRSHVTSKEWDSLEVIQNTGRSDAVSDPTMNAYALGVHMGIINPEKYGFKSFEWDERHILKDLYNEFISMNGSHLINYQEWLVMNNFGILPDTQESLLRRKRIRRSTADNRVVFINTVRKGDILISGKSTGGLVGHAAILTSDYWILEMAGGSSWARGIKNNNRQMGKDEWYEEYSDEWIAVYRCPDKTAAREAAVWADYNYFNPTGGSKKTVKIKYLITTDHFSFNPSYSSKLVVQAYYYGTAPKPVVKDLSTISDLAIAPLKIPSYFRKPYKLKNKGEF